MTEGVNLNSALQTLAQQDQKRTYVTTGALAVGAVTIAALAILGHFTSHMKVMWMAAPIGLGMVFFAGSGSKAIFEYHKAHLDVRRTLKETTLSKEQLGNMVADAFEDTSEKRWFGNTLAGLSEAFAKMAPSSHKTEN